MQMNSAVVDKRFVDKIGDKTAIENRTCQQRFCFVDRIMYYFEKERIHLTRSIRDSETSIDCTGSIRFP